jgi:hypothetical protein
MDVRVVSGNPIKLKMVNALNIFVRQGAFIEDPPSNIMMK